MMRKWIAGVSSLALVATSFGATAHPAHDHDAPAASPTGAAASAAYDSEIELLFEQVTSRDDTSGGLVAERYGTWGVDLAQKQATVTPGNDFFRHVNGMWLDSFAIPDDKSDFGAFNALGDLSDRQVRAIVEDAVAARRPTRQQRQIGALYASYMDTDRLERLGLAPLQPVFDVIDSANTPFALLMLAARTDGVAMPFSFFVGTDRRDTSKHQLGMSQGGLGMGERDFYLSDGSNFPAVRAAYLTYLTKLFELSGHSDPAGAAQRVFAFEKQIAEVHFTRADNRDPTKTLNTRTLDQLQREITSIPWALMLASGGVDVSKVADVNVGQPSAIAGTVRIWYQTPVATLKEWARVRALASNADYLPKAYRDASFEYRKVQTGQPMERPRDKRGVDLVNGSFGDAIGQIYVARHFPQASREAIAALVVNVKAATRARLRTLAWMSEDTRKEAEAKLDAFTVKVGVPEVWDNKDSVQISRTDLLGNMRRLGRWAREDNLSKLGKPVDKREWGMTPQTVNAYYSPLNNEIVFPAAILQPPFFDPAADPAVNYGGIGAVIGHEILHGFDDSGRRFDAEGRQRDWWTAEDNARFVERSDRLVAQYNTYEPLPGLFVNGRISLGENIADLGGITMALDAYRASLGGQPAPVLDGYTGEQRFFMGWAQVWRFKARDERMRQRVATAPHSPPQFRVNGVVRNVDAWYDAFGVKEGDALYLKPEDRVRIW